MHTDKFTMHVQIAKENLSYEGSLVKTDKNMLFCNVRCSTNPVFVGDKLRFFES